MDLCFPVSRSHQGPWCVWCPDLRASQAQGWDGGQRHGCCKPQTPKGARKSHAAQVCLAALRPASDTALQHKRKIRSFTGLQLSLAELTNPREEDRIMSHVGWRYTTAMLIVSATRKNLRLKLLLWAESGAYSHRQSPAIHLLRACICSPWLMSVPPAQLAR